MDARDDLVCLPRRALFSALLQAIRLGIRLRWDRKELVGLSPTLERNEAGELVAITMTDMDHRVGAVLWEQP